MTSRAIRHVRITPIALHDPPLLNAAGIHEPWALRTFIEIETASDPLLNFYRETSP